MVRNLDFVWIIVSASVLCWEAYLLIDFKKTISKSLNNRSNKKKKADENKPWEKVGMLLKDPLVVVKLVRSLFVTFLCVTIFFGFKNEYTGIVYFLLSGLYLILDFQYKYKRSKW